MKAVNTETSMAVYGYFSFGQLKLHNSYNISYADHRTKAVVLPPIVVKENYNYKNHLTY